MNGGLLGFPHKNVPKLPTGNLGFTRIYDVTCNHSAGQSSIQSTPALKHGLRGFVMLLFFHSP